MALIGEFGAADRDSNEEAETDTFMFYGEEFAVAQRIGAMPLLRFAAAADSGVQAEELEGLAAMHELLRDCLLAEPVEVERDGEKVMLHGWARFQKVAATNKVDASELMEVCGAIYRAVTGRPTRQPGGSAAGLPLAGESSKELSSSEESLSPIQRDPRVQGLKSIAEAGAELRSLAG